MLTLLVYTLVLINSTGVVELGKTDTNLECAAAIGYLHAGIEAQGGKVEGKLLVSPDGAFSVNMSVPGQEGRSEIVTIQCSPVII
jgi:hypothetical protein